MAIQKTIDQIKKCTKITDQVETAISSLAALQSRLGVLRTTDIVNKANQMSVINPAIIEFVESAKKLRDSVPSAEIELLLSHLAGQGVWKDKVE